MLNVIELVLSLLQAILPQIKQVPGIAVEAVQGVENAIAELAKVQGSDVTWQQLESLKIKTLW